MSTHSCYSYLQVEDYVIRLSFWDPTPRPRPFDFFSIQFFFPSGAYRTGSLELYRNVRTGVYLVATRKELLMKGTRQSLLVVRVISLIVAAPRTVSLLFFTCV